MPLKILRKREKNYSFSDSSVSSPESAEKNFKWTLTRAPLTFSRQIPIITATTPTPGPPSFPPTSTPCFKAAPPFQLSQTLLSPVSKKQSDKSFKVPKPGKAPNATREQTFDNLLTSQLHQDMSSKLVVNRRDKPIWRDAREADVERTRHYGGNACLDNLFSGEYDESEINNVPPVEIQRESDLLRKEDQKGIFSKTTTRVTNKPTLESVKKKVILENDLKDSDEFQKSNKKIDSLVQSKPGFDQTMCSETTNQVPQNFTERTRTSSPNENRGGRRSSLVNRSQRKTGGNKVINVLPKNNPAEKSFVNGEMDDTASHCICSDDEDLLKSVEKSVVETKEDIKRNSKVEIKYPKAILQVQRSSPRRASVVLQKLRESQDKENSPLRVTCGEVVVNFHLNQHSKETIDATKQNRKREQPNVEEISSPVLAKTSKSKKRNVPDEAVHSAPTTKHRTQDEPWEEKRQTRTSSERLKNKTLENGSQESILENTNFDRSVEYFEKIGLIPRKKDSRVGDSENTEAVDPFYADDQMKISAQFKAEICPNSKESESLERRTDRRAEPTSEQQDKSDKSGQEEATLFTDHGDSERDNISRRGDLASKSRLIVVESSDSEDSEVTVPLQKRSRTNQRKVQGSGKKTKPVARLPTPQKQIIEEKATSSADNFGKGKSREDSRKKKVSRKALSEKKESPKDPEENEESGEGSKGGEVCRKATDEKGESWKDSKGKEQSPKDLEGKKEFRKDSKEKKETGKDVAAKEESRKDMVGEEGSRKVSVGKEDVCEDLGEKKGGVSADEKNKKRKKKIEKKLTSKDLCSDMSSSIQNTSERWPKRERRRPGDYWVAPNLTNSIRKKESKPKLTCDGMFKSPTLDYSSGSEDDFRPRKHRRGLKEIGEYLPTQKCIEVESFKLPVLVRQGCELSRNRDAERREVKRANQRRQSKLRRLLPKIESRNSYLPRESSECDQGYGSLVPYFKDSCSNDRRSSQTLICHVDDVTWRNKNSGLHSENSKVRICSTVTWKSLSGILIEMDSGAVSGPQVDVFKHQVYVILEGTVTLQVLGQQVDSTLNAGDTAIVPAGRKFTILNNGANKARLNVLNFTDNV